MKHIPESTGSGYSYSTGEIVPILDTTHFVCNKFFYRVRVGIEIFIRG